MTREEFLNEIEAIKKITDGPDWSAPTSLVIHRAKWLAEYFGPGLMERVDDVLPMPHGTISVDWNDGSYAEVGEDHISLYGYPNGGHRHIANLPYELASIVRITNEILGEE